MIMTSSSRSVSKTVGQGRPAVRHKSRSNSYPNVSIVSYEAIILNSYRSCNEPIDVADVEDLSRLILEGRPELDRNTRVAKVGGHGEVGYGSHHGD